MNRPARTPVRTAALACLVLGLLAAQGPRLSWARGGRLAAAAHPAPPPAADDATPEAAAAQPQGCAPSPSVPTGTVAPPGTTVTLPSGRRPRRQGVATPGLTDWVTWYEARREAYEDLRRASLLTESNPLFQVGTAVGPSAGTSALRLLDADRREILGALRDAAADDGTQWIHTRAAAYVALGKVASTAYDASLLFDALATPDALPHYLQESAALGLGHLARTTPENEVSPLLLDRARKELFRVLEDGRYAIRTRAFSAVSLGLLAGQATARDGDPRAATADRLFDAWLRGDLPDETAVGVLLGLGEIDADAVPHLTVLVLEGCGERGRTWARPASPLVRAHALAALGRLGDAGNAPALVRLLDPRHEEHLLVRQAAALAATSIALRDVRARQPLGRALLRAFDASREPGLRHLILVGLGRLVAADSRTEDRTLLESASAGPRLLAAAREGKGGEVASGALALGLALRGIDPAIASGTFQKFRFEALEALREGLDDPTSPAHERAAFATALGLAGDRLSTGRLLADLVRRDADPELRAYAALALGLTGEARPATRSALRAAFDETRSELLRMRSATALGLLGTTDTRERDRTLDSLLRTLDSTDSQPLEGQIAITLGRLGDRRAVAPLARLLGDEGASHVTRAVACAALGLLGDGERRPTLASLRETCSYMTGSDVVYELLDLL